MISTSDFSKWIPVKTPHISIITYLKGCSLMRSDANKVYAS